MTGVLSTCAMPAELTDDLAALALAANREHSETRSAASAALGHAIACGNVLLVARRQVPLREWGRWCVEHLEFTQSVASKYVRIALNVREVERSGATTIGAALNHLSVVAVPGPENSGNTKRRISDADLSEARRLRAEGLSVRRIAAEFGVSAQTLEIRLDQSRAAHYAMLKKRSAEKRRLATKALRERERSAGIARIGGSPALAYSQLRRTAATLSKAIDEADDSELAGLLRRALAFTHKAEDEIVFALKVEFRTERRPLPARASSALQGRAPGGRKEVSR